MVDADISVKVLEVTAFENCNLFFDVRLNIDVQRISVFFLQLADVQA